jgi:hypothetical protein
VQPRRQVFHSLANQLRDLLPQQRRPRVQLLAWFVVGLMLAQTVSLPRIAAQVPLPASAPSTERRLRRWLANPAVTVAGVWAPLRRALLAPDAGQELTLVFDLSPHRAWGTLLVLGLVQGRRVLPLSWRVEPQQEAWSAPLAVLLPRLHGDPGGGPGTGRSDFARQCANVRVGGGGAAAQWAAGGGAGAIARWLRAAHRHASAGTARPASSRMPAGAMAG